MWPTFLLDLREVLGRGPGEVLMSLTFSLDRKTEKPHEAGRMPCRFWGSGGEGIESLREGNCSNMRALNQANEGQPS